MTNQASEACCVASGRLGVAISGGPIGECLVTVSVLANTKPPSAATSLSNPANSSGWCRSNVRQSQVDLDLPQMPDYSRERCGGGNQPTPSLVSLMPDTFATTVAR